MKLSARKIFILSLTTALLFFFSVCNISQKQTKQQAYLNLADSVHYVGMNTCRTCHENIYESFIKTGMGQSFDFATRQKSAADFNGEAVYDSSGNFYYQPFWAHDSLYVKEFRLENNDTVYRRTELVSYIVGSGQHTNSHICSFNNHLFQAPITFYTQQHKWDLAPGFEGGFNSRFSRAIGLECMTCHNGMSDFDKGSVNVFNEVKTGIDCERCHGAGELHVQMKQKGMIVDTSKEIDYSIVNPKKMSRDLQMSLCQRCHLQGLAVLKKGKDFDSFKPGMNLSEVWDVFLPETEESKSKFIMASQAERLRKSQCYLNSEMSCITCHNPHVSVKETPVEVFNNKCQSCHSSKGCTERMDVRNLNNNNCVDCHMPKSGSIDIPHVSITDHFIRKPEQTQKLDAVEADKVKQYLRLKCYTDEHPSRETMAKAYLSFYEKYSAREYLLDSAANYLFGTKDSTMPDVLIHYYFLKKDFNPLIAEANKIPKQSISDAWTYYRIGEAQYSLGNYQPAAEYFKEACAIQPLNMDFQNKLAASLSQLSKFIEAKKIYHYILQQQPKSEIAWSNLGFLSLKDGDFKLAETYVDKALALNPDYEQALINKAAICFSQKQKEKATATVKRILKINPQNVQARLMLEQLK